MTWIGPIHFSDVDDRTLKEKKESGEYDRFYYEKDLMSVMFPFLGGKAKRKRNIRQYKLKTKPSHIKKRKKKISLSSWLKTHHR